MSGRNLLYLKSAATIALLATLLLRVDISEVLRAIGRFGLSTWAVNLALYLGAWGIATLKWKALLPKHSIFSLLHLNFIGQFYSILLPGQIAGEIIKAYRLGRGKPNAEQIAASVVIDRITGFLGLLAVALAGMFFSRRAVDPWIIWVFLAFCALLLLGLFCLKFRRWFGFLRACATRFGRFGAQAARILDAWKRYLEQPYLLLLSIALGACFQFAAVWINIRFARELDIDIGFADWCWLFGVISVATMLPLTVGGIGLREGSFVGALALVGVPPEKALALSLAVFAILLAGAAIGGALEWTRRKMPLCSVAEK